MILVVPELYSVWPKERVKLNKAVGPMLSDGELDPVELNTSDEVDDIDDEVSEERSEEEPAKTPEKDPGKEPDETPENTEGLGLDNSVLESSGLDASEVELIRSGVELIVVELASAWIELTVELDDTASSAEIETPAVELDTFETDSPVLDEIEFVEPATLLAVELDKLSSILELALGTSSLDISELVIADSSTVLDELISDWLDISGVPILEAFDPDMLGLVLKVASPGLDVLIVDMLMLVVLTPLLPDIVDALVVVDVMEEVIRLVVCDSVVATGALMLAILLEVEVEALNVSDKVAESDRGVVEGKIEVEIKLELDIGAGLLDMVVVESNTSVKLEPIDVPGLPLAVLSSRVSLEVPLVLEAMAE